MFTSPFGVKPAIEIPDNADIIFVSDMFVSDITGGAELTSEAIISASPYNVFKIHSSDLTNDNIQQGSEKYWIFGNFSGINTNLFPSIIGNLKYSVIEYDYKFCKYRSPEKHLAAENKQCDCHEQMHGKMVSAFFYAANSLWWMSENQMIRYHEMFPFLSNIKNTVLSSVFDDAFFNLASELSEKYRDEKREKWLVVGSTSWIKGTEQAVDYCKTNNLDYELVQNLEYKDLLEKLSLSKGLVFLPNGADTCPRLVIEAKLLGCDLVLNENVQHANEEWFSTSDAEKTLTYLYSARERFWDGIRSHIERSPTISGYTTVLNCIDQNYPFEASIMSLFGFCDQVVVADGGSKDGTWERLQELKEAHPELILIQHERDWDDERFAVFDGLQKALARAHCTGEFCWQQDSDEVVHENDFSKIKNLLKQIPKNLDLLSLPIVEFWGGPDKVRVDVNPWKWRLSRNRPHITHGIPAHLRRFDEDGRMFAAPGTDGCDYIRTDTFQVIPCANFYDEQADEVRKLALAGDKERVADYDKWFRSAISQLPSVYHYSWFDIERKINTYKNYWSKHWQSLYNVSQEDTAENNMFFNKPWSEVNKKEIKALAKKLSKEMGGWIFHEKIDFSKKTPHVSPPHGHPSFISEWIKK